jgi:hypothetical protein
MFFNRRIRSRALCVIQSIKKHGFHITSKERYYNQLNNDKNRFEMRSFQLYKIVGDILRANNASKVACIKQSRHQNKKCQTNLLVYLALWYFYRPYRSKVKLSS